MADWLTPDRARAWCRVLAVMLCLWLAVWIAGLHGGADRTGTPIAADFVCFWAAGVLAVGGHAVKAYNTVAIAALEHAVQPMAADKVAPFLYPPTYLLLCLPLGTLPLFAALGVFLTTGAGLFVLCLRRLLPHAWALLPTLFFPGLLATAGSGQNGVFSGTCFGAAILLIERRPFIAGACLGLLTCKPQLSVLVPVALVAGRRWTALAGAGVSAAILVAISALTFGVGTWRAFASSARAARAIMEHDLVDPTQLQSMFGAVRILHGPLVLGYALQGIFSLIVIVLVVAVSWRRPGGRAEIAVLSAASLAVSPYVLDYDLVVLGVPLAWLAGEAAASGWRPFEKYFGLAAYMLPILTHGLAQRTGLTPGPPVLAGFLAVLSTRAWQRAQCRVA